MTWEASLLLLLGLLTVIHIIRVIISSFGTANGNVFLHPVEGVIYARHLQIFYQPMKTLAVRQLDANISIRPYNIALLSKVARAILTSKMLKQYLSSLKLLVLKVTSTNQSHNFHVS